MRSLALVRPALAILLGASALVAGGCRSAARGGDAPAASPESMPGVSTVMAGDVLHGRLVGGTACQTFTFEGTEYSLLDLEIRSETPGASAPRLLLADPDGKPLDMASILSPATGPSQAAAGIVLRKSGTYHATVCASEATCGEVAYAFLHDVRLSNPADRDFDLSPCKKDTLAFVASKGSRCVVTVRPHNACNVRAKILAVRDPGNGRALAPEAQLDGAPDPRVDSGRGNEARLDFIAPRSGRYLVIMTAEPCTTGKATAHVSVRPPQCRGLDIYYDAAPCACAPPAPAPAPCPCGVPGAPTGMLAR
jgi:hypothetical protein